MSPKATQWLCSFLSISQLIALRSCASTGNWVKMSWKHLHESHAIWQHRETRLQNSTDCEEIDPSVKWRWAQGYISTPSERNIMGMHRHFLLAAISPLIVAMYQWHCTEYWHKEVHPPLQDTIPGQFYLLIKASNLTSPTLVFSSIKWVITLCMLES